MDDFTSALYLGLHHESASLKPWDHLTTGVPAALREPAQNSWLANEVARMQGLERGLLAPSSLHLFWDLMGQMNKETLILADAGLYQIGCWGLERASSMGAKVRFFNHHSPNSLQRMILRQAKLHQSRLVVMTDGWCPHCGKAAPLPAYLAQARKYKGLLLVDDTQALGVLGKEPSRNMPYGLGGGGLLQWFDMHGQDIITICSLAKGLGVPLSVMSGSSSLIRQFEKLSEIRVHCSPVSAAHVHAGLNALEENRENGLMLRQQLLKHVLLFKKLSADLGFISRGSFFPLQSLQHAQVLQPQQLYQKLANKAIKALLLEPHHTHKPSLSFCISATHSAEQIKRAAAGLASALKAKKLSIETE